MKNINKTWYKKHILEINIIVNISCILQLTSPMVTCTALFTERVKGAWTHQDAAGHYCLWCAILHFWICSRSVSQPEQTAAEALKYNSEVFSWCAGISNYTGGTFRGSVTARTRSWWSEGLPFFVDSVFLVLQCEACNVDTQELWCDRKDFSGKAIIGQGIM